MDTLTLSHSLPLFCSRSSEEPSSFHSTPSLPLSSVHSREIARPNCHTLSRSLSLSLALSRALSRPLSSPYSLSQPCCCSSNRQSGTSSSNMHTTQQNTTQHNNSDFERKKMLLLVLYHHHLLEGGREGGSSCSICLAPFISSPPSEAFSSSCTLSAHLEKGNSVPCNRITLWTLLV